MTNRKVNVRVMEHRSNLWCKKTTTRILRHYSENGHSVDALKWVVLEKIDDHIKNPEKVLYEYKQRWVHRLQTNISGLNDEIQWGHFYR